MKKLVKKIIHTVLSFFKWVWTECKDWRTLVLLGIICLILSAPIWIFGILYFTFHWEWALVAGLAVWGFWMLPGAPFFALSVSITLAIKKIFQKVKKGKIKELLEGNREHESSADASEGEAAVSDNAADPASDDSSDGQSPE